MKTIGIIQNKCDRPGCGNSEIVLPNEKGKVKWEEVMFKKKKFEFCGPCISSFFGKEYADQFEIAKTARHLKKPVDAETDEAMFDMMKHLDARTKEVVTKPFAQQRMELLNMGPSNGKAVK